ncbi:gp53-like domain-containing protein [Pragia fontium]|uniref:gp53-like domain-containing protein n=1 Tax=Pragia fontium TaxID=82985 RepID=UPI00069C887D|nr:hypothetical protein [Pragia fontium]
MTIYQRPDEKILAESSKQGEVKDFPDISRGWGVAFDKTGGIPPMEWFNALGKRTDEAVRYLLQRGIAEWSKTEDYPVGALVSHNKGVWLAEQSCKGVEPKTNSLWKETALTLEQIRKLIPVNSVNGKTGNVVLNAGDVGALDKLGGVLDGDLHVQKSALAMVRLVTNHQNKFKADLFCNHTFGIATDNGAGGTTTRFRFTPDASKISGVWNFENCNVTKNGVNIPTVNQVANQLVADSTSKQVRYAKIATGRINRIDIGNVSFLVSGANNFGSPNNNLEYVSFSCRTESNKATIIHQIITPSFHPDHQNCYGWVFNAVDNTVELWLKSTSYGGFLGLTRLSGYHPSYISVCDKLIWQDIEPEKIVYVEPSKTISSNDPVIMKGDYGVGSLNPFISKTNNKFTDNLSEQWGGFKVAARNALPPSFGGPNAGFMGITMPYSANGTNPKGSWVSRLLVTPDINGYAANIPTAYLQQNVQGNWSKLFEIITTANIGNYFNALIGVNGYQKLPSGLIIQWGSIDAPVDKAINFLFPVSFINQCFHISGSGSINRAGGGISQAGMNFGNLTKTGATLFNDSSNEMVRWIAIGY